MCELVLCLLSCCEGIQHEGDDGHRADATRDGRDVGSEGCYFIEGNVTGELEATLTRSIGYTCRAYVDDDGTRAHHVGLEELRYAEGCDDDVCLQAELLDVGRTAVTDRDGAVARSPLVQEELRHGLADDVATAEDDAVLTTRLDVVAAKELDDPLRGS